MYPATVVQLDEAHAVCRGCPVWRQCLDEEIELPTFGLYGVRAGMTPAERRRARRRTA